MTNRFTTAIDKIDTDYDPHMLSTCGDIIGLPHFYTMVRPVFGDEIPEYYEMKAQKIMILCLVAEISDRDLFECFGIPYQELSGGM